MIEGLIIPTMLSSAIISIVLVLLNYGVFKFYFIRMLSIRYKCEYKMIGSPRFFESTENIEKLLSLREFLDDRHPVRKIVNCYYYSYKLMKLLILISLVLIFIIWVDKKISSLLM